MIINKFLGKTKEEAIEKAKKELGENAVVMNVKEVKPKGIFAFFKSASYEVTAALEEKETVVSPMNALNSPKKIHDNINLAADEKIEIPRPVRSNSDAAAGMAVKSFVQPKTDSKNEEKDIEKRLDDLSNMLEKKLGTQTPEPEEKQIKQKN